MILISSFRPLGEDPEWDANQMRAYRSWQMFAERIYLFGEPEAQLKSNKVHFVPSEQYPRIRDMAELAARFRGKITLICNGDIVIDPDIRRIERKLGFAHACCASSRRWHFKPEPLMSEAVKNASLIDGEGRDDRGRDVFMARDFVWGKVAATMPDKYRIGHSLWDAYITNAFREHWNDRFLDFSAMRLIFHPIHEGRRRPHDLEIANT